MPKIGGIFSAMSVSASGMKAQRARIDAISSNIANVHTTKVEGGGYYKRKIALLKEGNVTDDFESLLNSQLGGEGAMGVNVEGLYSVDSGPKLVYEPNHPDADKDGMVAYPDINIVEEMVDMILASRTFEANLSVFNAAKDMISQSLEI